MKRKVIAVFLTVTILSLTGCQKNPDSSIVKNKDFDNMIDSAKEDGGVREVEELAEKYDSYKKTLKDETLGVNVSVDAKVDIPATDKMSVVRVQQKKVSQELLEKVMEKLTPEMKYYEGSALQTRTKKVVEQDIQEVKQMIANLEEGYSEEDRESQRREYQKSIDALQEEYEAAPVDYELTDYPSDRKLHSVQESLEQEPENSYYQWLAELNKNGEVYYGVNGGAGGRYVELYAQNNENYGNCLKYRSCKTGYIDGITSVVVGSSLKWDTSISGIWKASEEPTLDDLRIECEDLSRLKEVKNETAALSMEEAREQADEVLAELGLTEYTCGEGDLYCEITDTANWEEELEYRKEYIFQYFRSVNGVQVNNYGEPKAAEGWEGDTYQKHEWPGERIVVYVNDDGIVGFDYLAPLEQLETIVDKANMKNFEEVKETFEQMIMVTQAMEEAQVSMDIDRVVLRYMRISEEDSFDTGLLVPVWDFLGTKKVKIGDYEDDKGYGSLITINAIDGSVIDKQLGY